MYILETVTGTGSNIHLSLFEMHIRFYFFGHWVPKDAHQYVSASFMFITKANNSKVTWYDDDSMCQFCIILAVTVCVKLQAYSVYKHVNDKHENIGWYTSAWQRVGQCTGTWQRGIACCRFACIGYTRHRDVVAAAT